MQKSSYLVTSKVVLNLYLSFVIRITIYNRTMRCHCRSNYSFNYPVSMLCNSVHAEWRRALRLYWQRRRYGMFLRQ